MPSVIEKIYIHTLLQALHVWKFTNESSTLSQPSLTCIETPPKHLTQSVALFPPPLSGSQCANVFQARFSRLFISSSFLLFFSSVLQKGNFTWVRIKLERLGGNTRPEDGLVCPRLTAALGLNPEARPLAQFGSIQSYTNQARVTGIKFTETDE